MCSWKRQHWMPKVWVWNVLLEIVMVAKKKKLKNLTTMHITGCAIFLPVGVVLGWADGLFDGCFVGFNVGDAEGFTEGTSVD